MYTPDFHKDLHGILSVYEGYEGAGDDRIRNSCRSLGGYCHRCGSTFQRTAARAMDFYCEWHQQSVGRHPLLREWCTKGQGTVEFVVVALVFLAMTMGIHALWQFVGEGLLVVHAAESASHSLGMYQMLRDTFLF